MRIRRRRIEHESELVFTLERGVGEDACRGTLWVLEKTGRGEWYVGIYSQKKKEVTVF